MSSADQVYDVAVVGLGAMGAAVAFHASRLGLSVLGIDRYDPPHKLGSTHAESRITRLAVAEGPQYLPFVARSHELWREIEAATETTLLHQNGGYMVTEPSDTADRWVDFTAATAATAKSAGVDYSLFSPEQMRQRMPRLRVPDNAMVGFEPTAGMVLPEAAVTAQLALARAHGAELRVNEAVAALDVKDSRITIHTEQGRYAASHVVIAAGPWIESLITDQHRDLLTVSRQVVYWFEADEPEAFSVERFPFVMWVGATIDDYAAFMPSVPGGLPGVKVLGEQFDVTTTAEKVDRGVSPAETAAFHERLVAPRLDGVSDHCLGAAVCLYTDTPDEHFLIDADPRSDRITVMSPCSGHGFKHSTALGEAVAQQVATGSSTLDLTPFARGAR